MAKSKDMDARKKSARIVIVENDDNDAFFIERALKKAGFAPPMRLADGQFAIEYFDGTEIEQKCDAVLLDLKMPRKNGFEVLEWLRQKSDSLPVFILSSSDEPRDMRRATSLRVTKFLRKQHPFADVAELLEELISSR